MNSENKYVRRESGFPDQDSSIRPVSMTELRKRYADELRAMNHVPENLADISDLDACSSMDCTGLMPSLPQSEAELESYEDLYRIFPKASEKPDKV